MKKLITSPPARRDLTEIWTYIAEDNPANATQFLRKIEAKCLMLLNHPLSGKDRSELLRGMRSLPVGNYIIFYRTASESLEIVRVLHAARDISSIK